MLCSLEGWEERCIYKLLEIQYDEGVDDFNSRFSSRPDVNVTIADFGYPLCAPIPYEPSYLLLEAAGYTAGKLQSKSGFVSGFRVPRVLVVINP